MDSLVVLCSTVEIDHDRVTTIALMFPELVVSTVIVFEMKSYLI